MTAAYAVDDLSSEQRDGIGTARGSANAETPPRGGEAGFRK